VGAVDELVSRHKLALPPQLPRSFSITHIQQAGAMSLAFQHSMLPVGSNLQNAHTFATCRNHWCVETGHCCMLFFLLKHPHTLCHTHVSLTHMSFWGALVCVFGMMCLPTACNCCLVLAGEITGCKYMQRTFASIGSRLLEPARSVVIQSDSGPGTAGDCTYSTVLLGPPRQNLPVTVKPR
jgi:hypothetical protein